MKLSDAVFLSPLPLIPLYPLWGASSAARKIRTGYFAFPKVSTDFSAYFRLTRHHFFALNKLFLHIKNIPSEIIAEYNDNVIINIESESKEAVYDRYNSFIRRMISYACIQAQNSKAPEYLIRSLVGSNDYYCIDVIGSGNNIRISGFNMNGTLNLKPTPFPSRLIEIQRGNYSTGAFRSNMMTLIFDGGWMVTMRLHLASLPRNGECISPMQLKYDIALKNLPYGMEDERIPLS